MFVTLRLDDLDRLSVSADLQSSDGGISLFLKPPEAINASPASPGGFIHFKRVSEGGVDKLHIYTSSSSIEPKTPPHGIVTLPPPSPGIPDVAPGKLFPQLNVVEYKVTVSP
jgi:hypothetical protein